MKGIIKTIGFKNEGFFKVLLCIDKEGKEIVLYRPVRMQNRRF